MTKTDRRVQRTQKHLQNALIELINERQYDVITVQDVVDRANVGRTTFYLHYTNKDDLFMSCHEAIVSEFYTGLLYPYPPSREELLSSKARPEMTSAFQHLKDVWVQLYPIFQGKDGSLLLRQIRDRSARQIEASLRAAFVETNSNIPLDILANYLAGAQIALMQWCLEKRQPHPADDLAQAFHRLQRAAIYDAFGLKDSE